VSPLLAVVAGMKPPTREEIASYDVVHWYFPGQGLCEEYATGDAVIDNHRDLVNCQECKEMIHA